MINEKRQEEIRTEARAILQRFGALLASVPAVVHSDKEIQGYRKEGEGNACEDDFRARLLANAPKKDADHVLAERGKW